MIFTIHRQRQSGSALISTMLVITVLTIIVLAFLQSMSIEAKTARSYMNRYHAELAAKTAATQAQELMEGLFEKYPDSCTAWLSLPNTQATGFYYRILKGTTKGSLPKDGGTTNSIEIKVQPLVSGAVSQLLATATEGNFFPGNLTSSSSAIDVNESGWIGGPSGKKPAFRAQWQELLEDPTAKRDLTFDPNKNRAVNGPIARYAYWIEDESFRVNVNYAGSTPRGGATEGANSTETSLQGVTDVAGIANIAPQVVALRDQMADRKFLTASQINYYPGNTVDQFSSLRFYVTDTSSALNFSRGGVKRLDLNQVVADTSDPVEIKAQISRIIAAFGNDYAMPDLTPQKKSKSDFGQRFFHTGGFPAALNANPNVTATAAFNYPDIYLQKLAANLRDYIDTDSQPTIVESDVDFTVRPVKKPDATDMIGFDPPGNGPGPSDTIAVGKENVPALQEYALRVKLISMNPPKYSKPDDLSASYEMEDSHYFEFFNPTTKPILVSDLGTDPFLLISHQFGYDTAGGNDIPGGRVIQIPLKNFVDGDGKPLKEFPAGTATVLTTDPSPASSMASGVNISTFYRPDAATITSIDKDRHFKGSTKDKTSSNMFRLTPKLGNTDGRAGSGSTDYDTHVLLGNNNGVLESFTALAIPEALSIKYDDKATTPPDSTKAFFRGGSLKGNLSNGTPVNAAVASGDPRSLNEQLSIRRYVSGVTDDITRFLNISLSGGPSGSLATFGSFANASFMDPTYWPDYAQKVISSAATAFARIANEKLKSIGQLGDIYDPVRETGTSGIDYARGGARSLRIGQSDMFTINSPTSGPDGLWDGNQTSVSRNRAAWRLADIFATNHDVENPGVININGVNRDAGTAIKAALYKLTFGGNATDDATLAGKTLDINSFVAALQERFPSLTKNDATTDNPFWERGELSELKSGTTPIFNSGTKLAGVDMKKVVDRGREELVRRALELITTKGNVYRAYCVGEALSTNQQGKTRVTSRQSLKVTFKLEPTFTNPLPADNTFNPTAELTGNATATKRFRQPDSYKVRVLSVNTY